MVDQAVQQYRADEEQYRPSTTSGSRMIGPTDGHSAVLPSTVLPHFMVTAGLWDTRVPYWGPTK